MPRAEASVASQRGLASGAAFQYTAQLAAARDPEIEGGADALGGERQAMAGGVADEEDAAAGALAQGVRDPVALVADGVAVKRSVSSTVGCLT